MGWCESEERWEDCYGRRTGCLTSQASSVVEKLRSLSRSVLVNALLLLGNNTCCGRCAAVASYWCSQVLTYTRPGVLVQGRAKHLTGHRLLPSVPLGLARGNGTWELYLAPAFWPCSRKALKCVLQNSRLGMCLTVLLDQSLWGRGGKLLLSYFDREWQIGLYYSHKMVI